MLLDQTLQITSFQGLSAEFTYRLQLKNSIITSVSAKQWFRDMYYGFTINVFFFITIRTALYQALPCWVYDVMIS